MRVIAHIEGDFKTKFGVPRQSGLVDTLEASIVFEPGYRNPDALRGLESFSHIWLLWQFSENVQSGWSPTVRPPRLGGNARLGVFATRSPFRPNAIGLSSVRLNRIDLHTPSGPILHVSGADLMDKSPIYDIKPYLPYTDSHPEAICHPAFQADKPLLSVSFPPDLLRLIPEERQKALIDTLEQDPRPSYHAKPDRVYGLSFHTFDIQFTVSHHQLTVCNVIDLSGKRNP
ncbi:MAG: tRNA (N6-threonylcarbamoyladenosine(37)-N6)-methyltransferase TrmO [Oscillospiraceae bacterium]|jgi:tRNA-Thr(GGU) m(6)t(6)A37 methyltransferase TsaA